MHRLQVNKAFTGSDGVDGFSEQTAKCVQPYWLCFMSEWAELDEMGLRKPATTMLYSVLEWLLLARGHIIPLYND